MALAYAIAIHKSQAPEFPAAVILQGILQGLLVQRNLVYTHVTLKALALWDSRGPTINSKGPTA